MRFFFFEDLSLYYYSKDDSDSSNIFYILDEAGFDSDNILFQTGFTKVTQFIAFDRMKNTEIGAIVKII